MSVTVTLNQSQVEKLMSIIEESERCLLEARSILSSNVSMKPTQAAKYGQTVPSIDTISWRLKGGRAAGSTDDFAFDFAKDRDGKVPREKMQIVDYIKKRGPFRIEGYEVTLSKDGKFLQRIRI
jgi:hypothetical protein